MLTIIMPPAPEAPDSSQSIIRQVFTRHRHRSCPATRHGRPYNIKHGDCGVTYEPGYSHSSCNAPPRRLPTYPWLQKSLADSSMAATSLHLSTRIPCLRRDPGLAVWRSASGGGTWSHSVRSRAAAERKIGADQPPATVPVFTAAGRYVDR